MVAIVKAISVAFATLNAIMMANPILIIVGLIAGLVAGFIYLWNTSEGFRNFWIGLWEGIKKIIKTAIDFIVGIFNTIVDFVKNNWQSLLKFIANPFVGAFELLYNNCKGFRNFVDNFAENIKQFFVNAWNSIVIFFTEGIPNFINSIIEWFRELPYRIGSFIGEILGSIVQFGIDVGNWVVIELPQIIQNIINWFAELPR